MSFEEWRRNGWIREHETSPQEVAALLAVIDRDLAASADNRIDPDWRFAIAYNAALQCAAVALKASGFEATKGGGAHHRTIESLRLTIKDDGQLIRTLQAFRAKRGGGIYETTGIASETEIEELYGLATDLRHRVRRWLQKNHPNLMDSEPPKPRRKRRR